MYTMSVGFIGFLFRMVGPSRQAVQQLANLAPIAMRVCAIAKPAQHRAGPRQRVAQLRGRRQQHRVGLCLLPVSIVLHSANGVTLGIIHRQRYLALVVRHLAVTHLPHRQLALRRCPHGLLRPRKCFTNDGWFKTGDMGIMDTDGYLYLRGRSKCMILGANGQNVYPEELEAVINNASYVVDSLVVEDAGGLTALIYPDYQQGQNDGMDREQMEQRLVESLPEFNKLLPAYAQLKKIEVMPEDFERTPKKSIKRYLYQRNK